MEAKKRAVFFDRDGVLNDTVDRGEEFLARLDLAHLEKTRFTAPHFYHEFKPKERIAEALDAVKEAGFLNILVTNQPDVRYGLMPVEEYEKIMAVVKTWLLDDIYVCLHGREDGCDCKKPKPGMLIAAAAKHQIDLPSSFIIGDTKSDVGAGKAAGCTTILIDDERNRDLTPDIRVANLAEAIQAIENF